MRPEVPGARGAIGQEEEARNSRELQLTVEKQFWTRTSD